MAFEDTPEYKQSIKMQIACTQALMYKFNVRENNIIKIL